MNYKDRVPYVNRDEVLRELRRHQKSYEDHGEELQARVVAYCISNVKSISAKRGAWVHVPNTPYMTCSVCSECSIDEDWLDGKHWNYCPECGARLGDAE